MYTRDSDSTALSYTQQPSNRFEKTHCVPTRVLPLLARSAHRAGVAAGQGLKGLLAIINVATVNANHGSSLGLGLVGEQSIDLNGAGPASGLHNVESRASG